MAFIPRNAGHRWIYSVDIWLLFCRLFLPCKQTSRPSNPSQPPAIVIYTHICIHSPRKLPSSIVEPRTHPLLRQSIIHNNLRAVFRIHRPRVRVEAGGVVPGAEAHGVDVRMLAREGDGECVERGFGATVGLSVLSSLSVYCFAQEGRKRAL